MTLKPKKDIIIGHGVRDYAISGRLYMNKWIKRTIVPVLALSVCAGMLTGCKKHTKIDGTQIATVVNGEEVPLGVISFQCRLNQAQLQSYYGSYMDIGEMLDRITDSNIGKTYGEDMRESVLKDTEKLVLMRQHAKDYGVELTDEEKAAIKKAAEGYIESNPQEVIDMIGASADHVAEVMELITIRSKMLDPIVAGIDKNVTDEEAQQTTITYVAVSASANYGKDGETRSAKDVAEEILELLKKEKTPAGTDIKDLVASIESSLSPSTTSYSVKDPSDATVDTAVIEAVKGLKDGEVAPKVIAKEDESCYYVVRMDSVFDKEKTESKKKDIIKERKQTCFNETVDKWWEEMDKTHKIDVISQLKIDSSELFTLKEKASDDTSDANE